MMKLGKNEFPLFALLCTCLFMAGCSSEETVPEISKPATKVMYAKTSFSNEDAPQTRMGYDDDLAKDYMNLTWGEGDNFSVFIAGNDPATHYDFLIEAPKNGTTYTADENFKCATFPAAIANGDKLDAIYPAVTSDVNSGNITVSVATQAQDGNKSTTHLSKCDYMTAHAIYSDATPNEVNLQFKDYGDGNAGRLGSIYRIDLTLPATVSRVDKIEISSTNSSGNSSLVTERGVNIQGGATAALPKTCGTVTLDVTNGATEVKEGKTSFLGYVVLFPSFVKERTIKVTTNAGVFTHLKNYDQEAIYTRGQFKLMTLNLTDSVPDMTSLTAYNAVGSGTAADPYLLYTEAQLQDWATQNNAGGIVVNKALRAGNAYAHFKLADNIELKNNWTPVGTATNPFVGAFDGNNKTISTMTVNTTNNSIYAGFIGRMTRGILKDLTVNGTVTADNTGAGNTDKTFAAGLVASMEGGTLSGTLTSNVVVTAIGNASVYAGGLVGAKKTEVAVSEGTTLSATGAVTATISATGIVAGSEIGAGSIIGNGKPTENANGGEVKVDAPAGTAIVKNGVFNSVDTGFLLNPWKTSTNEKLSTE